MNWIIILSFCVPLLLALRNQHAELQKQEKVNKLLEQCVIQGIADCKQMVGNLTHAASELESLKQKNQELAQQSVTSKQSIQILANQSECQLDQEKLKLDKVIQYFEERLRKKEAIINSLNCDNRDLKQSVLSLKDNIKNLHSQSNPQI